MSINYTGVRTGRMPVQRKEGSLKICVLTVFFVKNLGNRKKEI